MDLELDELKREFLAEAEEKVREIETAWSGGRTNESLERMSYLAHQLKGSGGSYGFQQISTEAAALESALETLTKENNRSAAPDVEQHVSGLHAEIERNARLFAER